MSQKDCRDIVREAFGIDALRYVNIDDYADMASVAASIDYDCRSMNKDQVELIRQSWSDLLCTLDVAYSELQKKRDQ
jgi:hypothetical protein